MHDKRYTAIRHTAILHAQRPTAAKQRDLHPYDISSRLALAESV